MKIKLNNDSDRHAYERIAGLQNTRALSVIIGAYAQAHCPEEEDFEAVVHKGMLPDSYRSNPSVFSLRVLASTDHAFEDSGGFTTPDKSTHVTIQLLRKRKPTHARRSNGNPSLKRVVKNWLDLNLSRGKKLKVKREGIPPFFFAHPEQFKYQIKNETSTPIKILKLKKSWLISRK